MVNFLHLEQILAGGVQIKLALKELPELEWHIILSLLKLVMVFSKIQDTVSDALKIETNKPQPPAQQTFCREDFDKFCC